MERPNRDDVRYLQRSAALIQQMAAEYAAHVEAIVRSANATGGQYRQAARMADKIEDLAIDGWKRAYEVAARAEHFERLESEVGVEENAAPGPPPQVDQLVNRASLRVV